jgi:beta-lactamase class A
MPPERRLLLTRRSFGLGVTASVAAAPALADGALEARFRAIEARTGGRLGVWAGQVGGDNLLTWREHERFLMCSTFKALAVAAVLTRVDHGEDHLDRWIKFRARDLQPYAPIAKANVDKGGMTLETICAGAVELSDNTCANLMLDALGGPQAVTRYIRSLDDNITRLDRTEPTLNDPGPAGDLHDTTTPASMTGLWRHILFGGGLRRSTGVKYGPALSAPSLALLSGWLEASVPGPKRLKAATPPGWTIGHKTGTAPSTAGDVAVWTSPTGEPILIAVYLEAPGILNNSHDDAFAEAGQLALNHIAGVKTLG